jgi:hypothetical protein
VGFGLLEIMQMLVEVESGQTTTVNNFGNGSELLVWQQQLLVHYCFFNIGNEVWQETETT